jgi:cytochrome c-type biogenesis protein CcmF
MIPEIGHLALILALCVALLQSSLPLIGAARGEARLIAFARDAALIQAALICLAFGALMRAFVTSDFSVALVAEHSHTLKPMLYKVAGLWGNHEGSLLLWVTVLSLFGAGVALIDGRLPSALRARVLAIQGQIAVGFLLFILLTSNPFLRLDPAPVEGQGLNPLLQDPGLAFHPPFLYLGYVGFSVTFAFAVAALIEGRVDPAWARWVRPWALLAWVFLTIGISLGSWWAYYTLGWGGFWFWDPVENASFMPWLMGTALIHSALVVEKRDTLKGWTILLAILTFSLSLLGTFLVRSGVLTSVHAFATDPTRGVFILAFLVLVVGGALTLYAWRAPSLVPGGLFAPISREGALIFNNWLLASGAATVLIGTLYPLVLDAAIGAKVTVGPPYFNLAFGALMAPLFVVMAIGPMLAWKRADLRAVLPRLHFAGLITAISVLAILWLHGGGPVLALAGIGLGVWIACGAITDLAQRTQFRFDRARGLPRSAYGGALAHLGIAVSLIGITGTVFWTEEHLAALKPGDQVNLGAYEIIFDGAVPVTGPNYTADRGNFRVRLGAQDLFVLHPESRRFTQPPQATTFAAIRPTWRGDLYVALGEPSPQGWTARLYLKPLAPLIWFGGLLMALGGLLSLSDRRLRIGAPKSARGAVPVLAGE